MFDDWKCQAEEIGLLESAFANHRLRHLPGDGDERDRIHVSVGNAGDEVRGAGSAGAHANPRPARGARVALSGESPALFVPRQNGADFPGPRQRLMQFHAGAAGVGEDRVHPFSLQGLNENIAALHDAANFGARGGRGRGICFRGLSVLAHNLPCWVWRPRANKKPTTVSSRG